jgi:hypothetical protein
MKKVVPVRLIKNEFYKNKYNRQRTRAQMPASLYADIGPGARRRRECLRGMIEGELEIGQMAAGNLREIKPAGDIVRANMG